MQPTTPPTTPATPSAGNPVVEFVRTQRQNAGIALASLAVAFLLGTGYLAVKGIQKPTETETTPDKSPVLSPLDPDKPDAAKTVSTSKQRDFQWGIVGALSTFLALAGGAIRLLVFPPPPTEAEQRTEARALILSVGGLLALFLIANGGLFFWRWNESVVNWLEKGKEEEQRFVLIPILMVALGAAIGLAAVTPARAEERNNPALRKLVYGTNLGLTAMVLLVVLVIANVVFAYRVPNKIDMTTGDFYSMSKQTEEFLRALPEPMQVYAIMPESGNRMVRDLRDVLMRFQETSRNKLTVKFVSPISSTSDLADLKANYSPVQDGEMGILITFPSDKKRFSFIPIDDFFTTEPGPRGEPGKTIFTGEGRLVKELLFLADNKQKPKVYFTQSSEEMEISGRAEPRRGATQLRAFLEKNYLDVQPLVFENENPKVPDDCAVLVVADPQKPLDAKYVEAIRKYMVERKGKLVVLSGATPPSRTQRKVLPTGLEPLLVQFNVSLGDKYLFGLTNDVRDPPNMPPVGFTTTAVKAQNPIARLFRRISIQMAFPREVNPLNTAPGMAATPLLATDTEQGTWLTDEFPAEIRVPAARVPSRFVGVVVSEGATARVAVYGNGLMVSDLMAGEFGGESPPAFDLLGATVDWLRDRPPVPRDIESKAYAVYALPGAKTIDTTRLKYLPVALGLIVVVSLGLGMWVIRRQ